MQHLSGKEIIPGIPAIFAFGAKMYGPLAPAGRYWEAGKRYLGFLFTVNKENALPMVHENPGGCILEDYQNANPWPAEF